MSEYLTRDDPRLPSLVDNGDFEDWRQRLHEYIRLRGFRVWSDPVELRPIIEAALAAHPKEAAALRAGKEKLVGFFVARVMAATIDGAEPVLTTKLIRTACRSYREREKL